AMCAKPSEPRHRVEAPELVEHGAPGVDDRERFEGRGVAGEPSDRSRETEIPGGDQIVELNAGRKRARDGSGDPADLLEQARKSWVVPANRMLDHRRPPLQIAGASYAEVVPALESANRRESGTFAPNACGQSDAGGVNRTRVGFVVSKLDGVDLEAPKQSSKVRAIHAREARCVRQASVRSKEHAFEIAPLELLFSLRHRQFERTAERLGRRPGRFDRAREVLHRQVALRTQ